MYDYSYGEPSFGQLFVSYLPITLVFIVLLCVLAMVRKGNRGLNAPMSVLVLREFYMSEDENEDTLAYMEGRPSGLMNWFLTVIGLGATTFLSVKRTELSFRSSSLSGTFYSLMSLKSISSVHCGFYRPLAMLVLGILFVLLALAGLVSGTNSLRVLFLVLAGICFWRYHFNKLIRVMVQTNGGSMFGMLFKPSLIEGVDVNIDKANEVVELINRQIMSVQNQ